MQGLSIKRIVEVRPSLNIVTMLLSEIRSGKYDFKTGK